MVPSLLADVRTDVATVDSPPDEVVLATAAETAEELIEQEEHDANDDPDVDDEPDPPDGDRRPDGQPVVDITDAEVRP